MLLGVHSNQSAGIGAPLHIIQRCTRLHVPVPGRATIGVPPCWVRFVLGTLALPGVAWMRLAWMRLAWAGMGRIGWQWLDGNGWDRMRWNGMGWSGVGGGGWGGRAGGAGLCRAGTGERRMGLRMGFGSAGATTRRGLGAVRCRRHGMGWAWEPDVTPPLLQADRAYMSRHPHRKSRSSRTMQTLRRVPQPQVRQSVRQKQISGACRPPDVGGRVGDCASGFGLASL